MNGQWNNQRGGFQQDRGASYRGRGSRGSSSGPRGRGRGRGHDQGNRGRGSFGTGLRGASYQQQSYNPCQQPRPSSRSDNAAPKDSYPSAPAIPSFGLPLPGFIPAVPSTTPSASSLPPTKKHKPNAKRKTNFLGLTPKGEDYEDSEDDANDEAQFASLGGLLQFEYKGATSVLGSTDDVKKWIAERKKRWPTRARVEERKQEEGKRRQELAEARKKVWASQREAAAKKEQERADAKGTAVEQGPEQPDEQVVRQGNEKGRRKRGRGKRRPTNGVNAEAVSDEKQGIHRQQQQEPQAAASQAPDSRTNPSIKEEPDTTPAADAALEARRAKIEALRRQIEQEEQELAQYSQPARTASPTQFVNGNTNGGPDDMTKPPKEYPAPSPRTGSNHTSEALEALRQNTPNSSKVNGPKSEPSPKISSESISSISTSSSSSSGSEVDGIANSDSASDATPDSDVESDTLSLLGVANAVSAAPTTRKTLISSDPTFPGSSGVLSSDPVHPTSTGAQLHLQPHSQPQLDNQQQQHEQQPRHQAQKTCRYFTRHGHCRYGSTCQFFHPPSTSHQPVQRGHPAAPLLDSLPRQQKPGRAQRERFAKSRGKEKARKEERRTLWQVLVGKEREEEERVMLQAVGVLGRAGVFDE